MSTSTGSTKSGAGVRLIFMLACVVFVGLIVLQEQAEALSPPIPKADVFFSNGGRILAMKADGNDRRVVFGKQRSPKNDELGAIDPIVSPDGQTVAFNFKREQRGMDLTDVWTVGVDGSGPKKIFRSTRALSYGDPTFMPNGRLIVAFYERGARFIRTGLISVDVEGGLHKPLFSLRERRRPFTPTRTVAEPDFPAVGGKVLYLVTNSDGDFADEGFENPMMVRDLESGETRQVADDAYDGSWSRNGKRIVYSAQTTDDDFETCWWESGCFFAGQLAIVNADGSGRRMLTETRLDERSPDWSQDGRIVFHSSRNLPWAGEAGEIYSIRPNGQCLTMLTNGSPASLTPSWSSYRPSSSSPAECEGDPPSPTVEVRVPRAGAVPGEGFWLGRDPGTRLLSGVYSDRAGSLYLYLDCDRQFRRDCDRPTALWTSDICQSRGQMAGAFGVRKPVNSHRGAPVFRNRGAEIGQIANLIAGRSVVSVLWPSGSGPDLARREVEQLRRLGQNLSTGVLPRPRFPRFDIRLMQKVNGSFGRTNSVRRTARRLGIRPQRVRQNLRFSRQIKIFGDYETVNCPRRNTR